MPKAFDDQVEAIKKSGKSEDEAYAIATASWKKSHGGKTPAESKKEEATSPWVTDYGMMDKIIAQLQPMLSNYKIKASVILDRGDTPAMTVYSLSPEQLPDKEAIYDALASIGYTPLNPVRPMKLKNGARGIKFSVQRSKKTEAITKDEIFEAVLDGTLSLEEAADLIAAENLLHQ